MLFTSLISLLRRRSLDRKRWFRRLLVTPAAGAR